MRKSVFTTVMAAVFAVMAMTPAFAGSLDQAASPTSAGGGAMYTLENIYQRLLNGTTATKRVGPFAEPVAGPAATGHTLDDIYNLIGTRAPVPKTGQTACYNATVSSPCPVAGFPGQDGDKLKGVANPSPRFTAANGTVTDNLTGLIWLRNANCANATRTWAAALNDVVSLNTAGTMNSNSCSDTSNAGSHQTDWRLPNVKELQSLIDFQNVSPALPTGHPFTSVQSDYYWSATTYADDPDYAWLVYLDDGGVGYDDKTDTYYVLPVR